MSLLKRIAEEIEKGEVESVLSLTKEAIAGEVPAGEILDKGLIAGMNVVGERFGRHDLFLPDVLMAAKAMNGAMEELKPLLVKEDVPQLGKVVIGTIQGDLHDIGKNLVGIMLKGAGFEVIDLGSDVAPEKFVDTAEAEGATVIGMSALLTTTMANMSKTVDLVKGRGLSGKIRTIIGGAPVSEKFANRIGADEFGFDAASAVDRVRKLIEDARA